jgi:CheY-like chemotaxis protein
MDDEPRRAYLIKWAVANEMEALVYAESAKDALERFEQGAGDPQATMTDWRVRQPTVKRWPNEDR